MNEQRTSRQTKDTPEANVQVVKQTYAAFSRGDIPAVLSGFAEDAEWLVPGPKDIPFAGPRRGRNQVAKFFEALNEAEEVQRFEPKEFIAQADKVVVLGYYQARVKSTGRTAATDWAHVFTLRDGKVVSFREYYDTAAAVAAYRGA